MGVTQCDSVSTLKRQIEISRDAVCRTETEESWDAIARGISELTVLCANGACDYPAELVPTMRAFSRPLNSAMNSERTKLSGTAIDLISTLASGLGAQFDPLLPVFFPTLLTLCTRSNKVIVTRARACIITIIEATQLPAILTYLLHSVKDKSSSLRMAAAEGVLTCMNCFNPPDLEKDARATDIEAIIRSTARDANADIRKISRKVFEAYKLLLPSRVDNFTAPLSPIMKKYLDIRSKQQTSTQPDFQSRPQPVPREALATQPKHLSSSTSALRAASSTLAISSSSRPLSHVRAVSSSAIVLAAKETNPAHRDQKDPIAPRRELGLKSNMPPPDYIPVRPTQQPSRPIISATRSTSAINDRIRTVSAAAVPSSSVQTISKASTSHSGYPLRFPQPLIPSRSQLPQASSAAGSVSSKSDNPIRPSKTVPTIMDVSGGPRRVPLPVDIQSVEVETRKSKVISDTKASGTNTSNKPVTTVKLKPVVKAPATKANEKAKPVPTLPTSASVARSIGDSSSSRRSDKAGGATQPTLSQLSRTKAVHDQKSTRPQPAKPVWGRPMAHKATKSKGERPGPPKIVAVPATLPASIPLPPSPTPSHSSSEADRPNHVQDHEDGPEEAAVIETATKPEAGPIEPFDAPVITAEAQVVAVVSEALRDDTHSVTETADIQPDNEVRVEITGSTPTSTPMATPPAAAAVPLAQTVAPTATPISALLSSIQHGFLFTPSSPLSPPENYFGRTQATGIPGLTIPFPLHTTKPQVEVESHDSGASGDVEDVFPRLSLEKGVLQGRDDGGRPVLTVVKVNK